MCFEPEINTSFNYLCSNLPSLWKPENRSIRHRKTKYQRSHFSVILLMLLSDTYISYCWVSVTEMRGMREAHIISVAQPQAMSSWSLPALLQKDDILPPHLGEMIGHRCAHDTTTTDDHLCLGRQGHRMRFGSWRTASGWGPLLPSSAASWCSDHRQQPVKHHVCQQLGDVLSLR